MSRFADKKIDEKISILLNGEDNKKIKRWNEGLGIKFLILLPSILFLATFYIFNDPKNLYDILIVLLYPIVFISLGVILLFAMER